MARDIVKATQTGSLCLSVVVLTLDTYVIVLEFKTNKCRKQKYEREDKNKIGPRTQVKGTDKVSFISILGESGFFCYFDIISGMGEGVKGGKQDLWLMQHVQRSTRNDLSMTENIDNNCGGQFI